MANSADMAIGQRWAYRVGNSGALAEAQVLALGVEAPALVLVKFIDDATEEWVPPGRLKVRWEGSAAFLEREAKWSSITTNPSEVEWYAVELLFVEFIEPAANLNWARARRGTVSISDFDLADVFIGGGLEELVEGHATIEENGTWSYSWPVARAMGEQLCRMKPRRVMGLVHTAEANPRWADAGTSATTPRNDANSMTERDLEWNEKTLRPACIVLRAWCGKDVAEMSDELLSAQRELRRLSDHRRI